MPPKINLNPVLNKYNQFVETNKKNERAVGTLKINGKNGTFEVATASESCYGKKAGSKGQLANNDVRKMFFDSIVKQFGRSTLIPKNVLKALLGKEYDGDMSDESSFLSKFLTGTPLEARQIKKVIGSIEKETRGNAYWLADNLVRNAFKLLDAEVVDTNDLMDSLMNLFEGVLPPKWEKATHFSKDFLNDKFGTRNIGELDRKVREQVYDLLHDPDFASKNAAQSDSLERNQYLKTQIAAILGNLKDLFSDSRVGKKDHVDVFCNLFKDLRKGGDVRVMGDYAYDATYVTNTAWIKKSQYAFDQNATYDATYSTSAHKFVKDMLCAAAFAEEGTFDFGNAGDAPNDKLVNWLQTKLKGTLISLGEEQFPSFDVVKDFKAQDPVSIAKMCINLLRNDGGVKTLVGKEKEWFEAVVNEVETFGQRKLGTLLVRHGVTTPFESKDRETFDSIARSVFGTEAGREGGAGCVGLFDDGKAFKFLTSFTERLWFDSGVKSAEKRQVNQATDLLRKTLVGFAKNISPGMENMVSKILAGKRMKGVDLLWRTDVAKAIDLLAPYIWDKEGRGACWETLAEATSENKFSSLKDVSDAITVKDGQKANARRNDDHVEANAGGGTGAKPEENLAQPQDDGNAPVENVVEDNAPVEPVVEESVKDAEQKTVLKELKQYGHDELGKGMEAGDAFDPALSADERKLVLAKDVMEKCKGKHFHSAVCHVINELSQRSRAFVGNEFVSRQHTYFLEAYAEEWSTDNSKDMKAFAQKIKGEYLSSTRVAGDRIKGEIEAALELLVALYGDQQELETIADDGLRKQLEGGEQDTSTEPQTVTEESGGEGPVPDGTGSSSVEKHEPESNELYTKLEPNDEGESATEEKNTEVNENAANGNPQPEVSENAANGNPQPEVSENAAQTKPDEERSSDSVETTASQEETAPQEMAAPKKSSLKNAGSAEEMMKFKVISEITQDDLNATSEYDRAYLSTQMSYNKRLEVAYVKMERALKGNAWFRQLNEKTQEMYLEEFQEVFDALKSGMINNSHVAGGRVSPKDYMNNKSGLLPDERDREVFDIPYNLSYGVTDRTVTWETRNRLFLGMLSAQRHAQDLLFSLEESLNYEQGADDGEGEWTDRLQKILADVTGLSCYHEVKDNGRVGKQRIDFKMSQGQTAFMNLDRAFKDERSTMIESFDQAINVLNPKIEALTARIKAVGNDVAGSKELRTESERLFDECTELRNRIERGLRYEAYGFVKSYEKYYKEFEENGQVEELNKHIKNYKTKYDKYVEELKEADEILARLPAVEELRERWSISSEFQLKSARPVVDKSVVPIDENFKMTDRIKTFLTEECNVYRAQYDECGGSNYDMWQWKIKLALDPAYQEKVLAAWGDRLEPLSLATFGITPDMIDTIPADPPSKDLTVVGEGLAGGIPVTEYTGKEKSMVYHNCADVTHPAGTITGGGQEEGLARDWPPYLIAYMIRKEYIVFNEKTGKFDYVCDKNGVPKVNNWLGSVFPCVTYSTNGKPNEPGDLQFRITPYLNTGSSSFGADSTVNTDPLGFQTLLQYRVGAKQLDVSDKQMRDNVQAFHKELRETLIGASTKSRLLKDPNFGYGGNNSGKNKCLVRNEAMFIAHNCSDKWGFNVFGKKPKKEVANLIKIIKSGKYGAMIEEAKENYRQTQEKQIKGWAVLLKLLGIKKVATAEPGTGYFFGPVEQTIKTIGFMLGKFGGKDLERVCYKYSGDFDEEKVRSYYKRDKE